MPLQPAPVTVVDLLDAKAATTEEFTIAADWGGMAPTPAPAAPMAAVDGPVVAAKQSLEVVIPASKEDDDLFGGFTEGGDGAAQVEGDRTLKPVRSIIKTSSFADRGLQKSPSGRRVAFNL